MGWGRQPIPDWIVRIVRAGVYALLVANVSLFVGRIIIIHKVGTGDNPPPSPQIAALRIQYAQLNPLVSVALSLPLFVLLINTPSTREPRPPGICANCGYNLTGNTSGVCPECGVRR